MRICTICGDAYTRLGRNVTCGAQTCKDARVEQKRVAGLVRPEARFGPRYSHPVYKDPFKVGRASAKQRGREWTITKEQYLAIMGDRSCFYCSRPCEQSGGLDRVDSDRGYTPDNVVPCCLSCNSEKKDWPQSVFMGRQIYHAFHSAEGSPGGEA